MKCLRRLFAHYEHYHLHGPQMLRYAGLVGAVGFPVFYVLRLAKSAPAYDDTWIRLAATLLCLLLVLKDRWPQQLKRYYIAFSYPALIFTLPVFLTFTALKNGGGAGAVGNTLMVAFFVILMTDWRNTIVMLAVGISAGVLLYMALDPNPSIPTDYVARLPLLILVVIGGSFFKFAGNQAAAEAMRRGYASIAGSIAHEMRNPLSQIKTHLERMQQALPPPAHAQGSWRPGDMETLYRHLAESELAVRRGLQVIAMTLDQVSDKPVDTGDFSFVCAAEAACKAVQEYGYASEAERARVSVRLVEGFSFRGDETAFLFVLFNLIKNALYYAPLWPRTRVILTVEPQQVRVRDTGPGIPAHRLKGLFEPFRSMGKSGGTGLGLAYCQRVMRSFGGQIRCESVEGAFTEFTLSFPTISPQESERHRKAAIERARSAFAGRRLLIVDDDAAQRITTRHKLQVLGATLEEATNGQRALEMLGRQPYDLVLLDLNMPLLDGYALAQRIRQGAAPANREVAIVAHTSEPAHLAVVKTQKAGMDGFVGKPCAQLPLLQSLQQALAHAALRARPEASPLAGRRILLADDSAFNRLAVAAYLQHAGATVVEAPHGPAALEQLPASDRWDAILLDINMPGMSGLETAQAIRAGRAPWRDTPIVALTAHSDEQTVVAARAAGMNDFLTKPVDPATLYAKLGRLVGGTPGPAPMQPAVADGAAGQTDLLNRERLESFRRIGILDELLSDYLPEIARLVAAVERAAAAGSLEDTLDALHSLLGMSGEAGTQALHRLVRGFYVAMIEARAWPDDPQWLAQIKSAAACAETALRAYGAKPSAAAAAV